MKEIKSEKYIKKKLREHIEFPCAEDKVRKRMITCNLVEVQRAFEDGYECATKWIDVKDKLPERGCDVLVAIQDPDDTVHVEIRWRSIYDDVVVDENGFAIYPSEEKVLAWMPLPKYKMNTNNK